MKARKGDLIEEVKTMVSIPDEYKKVLVELNLDTAQASLFLLGVLIGRIGAQQWKDGKSKPILNKINFQGLPATRLRNLFVDVFNSMRNHHVLNSHTESIYAASTELLERSMSKWNLSDKENVYYILAGYAYETQRILTHSSTNSENNESQMEV